MFRIGKFRESIFLKIILVFVLAAVANATVLRIFQHDFLNNDLMREHRLTNMAEYGRELVKLLGEPPAGHARLRDLAQRLHIGIRTEGPEGADASAPEVPTIESVEKKLAVRYSSDSGIVSNASVKTGRFSDYLAIVMDVPIANGNQRYLFLLESENTIDAHPELLLILLASLITILAISFFAVRSILSPLKEIERGVRNLTLGDLETKVEVASADELGRLARSFNEMIGRVKAMISSKEQLLLDVSHEFRSPLTRIKVALEIPGPDARTSIDRSLKDLETMISELLESARLGDAQGRLRLEKIDLSDTLQSLASIYEGVKPGLKVKTPNIPVWTMVDPSRIEIAFRNLVENAIKYSSNQDRAVDLRLSLPMQGRVRVEVVDYGIGIPPDELPRIFEPFYRVDRSRMKSTGGYGLGLSLVQKIIVAHRGQISVESTFGRGSRMIIDLPIDLNTEL